MVAEMLQKYIFLSYQVFLVQRNVFVFNQYGFVFTIFFIIIQKIYM